MTYCSQKKCKEVFGIVQIFVKNARTYLTNQCKKAMS